jgi:hypothetical protein
MLFPCPALQDQVIGVRAGNKVRAEFVQRLRGENFFESAFIRVNPR